MFSIHKIYFLSEKFKNSKIEKKMEESTKIYGDDSNSEIELQNVMGGKDEKGGGHKFQALETSLEENSLKDEEEVLYRYSRSTKRPIHYGAYIPLLKNKQGEPKFLIGPDCKFFIFDYRAFFHMPQHSIFHRVFFGYGKFCENNGFLA